jgi:hypothetical protein
MVLKMKTYSFPNADLMAAVDVCAKGLTNDLILSAGYEFMIVIEFNM